MDGAPCLYIVFIPFHFKFMILEVCYFSSLMRKYSEKLVAICHDKIFHDERPLGSLTSYCNYHKIQLSF